MSRYFVAALITIIAASSSTPVPRCKLPGWPGHPAPSCNPNLDECCPGTVCKSDPDLEERFTCQGMHEIQTAQEHAALAHEILLRAQPALVMSLADLTMLAGHDAGGSSEISTELINDRFMELKKQQQQKKRKQQPSPPGDGDNQGFDWKSYVPPGSSNNGGSDKKDKKKDNEGAGGSGFDYSKYVGGGANSGQDGAPSSASSASKKKDDKPEGGDGGGFDYSKYYNPSTTTTSSSEKKKKTTANMEFENVETGEANNDRDALQRAAKALLEADDQIKRASHDMKNAAILKAKAILDEAQDVLDRARQHIPPTTSSSAVPTTVDFDWHAFVPANIKVNVGDRSPGTLDGPCGSTSSHDFGACHDDRLVCVGLQPTKPGRCALKSAMAQGALTVVRLVEDDVDCAVAQLALAMTKKARRHSKAVVPVTSYPSVLDNTSDFTPAGLEQATSSSLILAVVGALILAFFLWSRSSKRRTYQRIGETGGGSSWAAGTDA